MRLICGAQVSTAMRAPTLWPKVPTGLAWVLLSTVKRTGTTAATSREASEAARALAFRSSIMAGVISISAGSSVATVTMSLRSERPPRAT